MGEMEAVSETILGRKIGMKIVVLVGEDVDLIIIATASCDPSEKLIFKFIMWHKLP